MDGLVFGVLELSVMSVEVIDAVPAVFKVILKFFVPPTRGAFAGKPALASVAVIPTVSVTELTMFQFASTAFTTRLKPVPAVWANGVPVLPIAVPGAAVSPGASNCSLANDPAPTLIGPLVLLPLLPSLASVAVTLRLPDVFNVTLKVCVPAIRAELAGSVALPSEEVIPTVSVTFVMRFQFASTALAMTINALPEV